MSKFSRFDGCYKNKIEFDKSLDYEVYLVTCCNNEEGSPLHGDGPIYGSHFILNYMGKEYKYDFGSQLETTIERIKAGDL